MDFELTLEECVVAQSLFFAFAGQMSIEPVQLAVAIEFRPVVVPRFGTILGFADIVW